MEFDDETHGIHIMYRVDGMVMVDICHHVERERALALIAVCMRAVAERFEIPLATVVEAAGVLAETMPTTSANNKTLN